PFAGPAPVWLADWAEAVGGFALGSDGVPVAIPFETRRAWRESATKNSNEDSFSRALHWWLADSAKRPSSPFSLVPASDESLLSRLPVAPRDPQATSEQIDFAPYYSLLLDKDPDANEQSNSLAELPAGLHRWNGIAFDVRGVIQLGL